jgi:hypothetical protein
MAACSLHRESTAPVMAVAGKARECRHFSKTVDWAATQGDEILIRAQG